MYLIMSSMRTVKVFSPLRGAFRASVEEIEGHAVGILAEVSHPVRDQLVILGQKVPYIFCKGNADLAGVLLNGSLRSQMRSIEGFEVFLEGLCCEFYPGDGLHVLFQLSVCCVPGI